MLPFQIQTVSGLVFLLQHDHQMEASNWFNAIASVIQRLVRLFSMLIYMKNLCCVNIVHGGGTFSSLQIKLCLTYSMPVCKIISELLP